MAQELKSESPTSPVSQVSAPGKITYEQFLEWADEDTWAEWVNGEVTVLSPASRRHQRLLKFLLSILTAFIEAHDLGELIPAPFQMKSGVDLPGREPDLIFVVREHLDRLKENYLDGPADLVVEIVSHESRSRDRGEKFYEYEAAGVPEYWMLDPIRKKAEFYRLGDDGTYTRVETEDGIFCSAVLKGFSLRVDWLWQEPPPKLVFVLKQFGLVKD
jgi:Uma2 family endonuclease